MASIIREKITKLLFKLQSAPTTDPTADITNFVRTIAGTEWALNPEIDDTNEFNEGLGAGDFSVGTAIPTLTVLRNLIGAGTAGGLWDIDALMVVCGWVKTAKATPIPATGTTTATAGSATTLTVDTSVDTDWPTVDGSMIGEAVLVNGTSDIITDYQVTGDDAVISLAKTYSPVLDNTATIVRPVMTKYVTGTPSPHPFGAASLYMEGFRQKLFGLRGSHTQTWTARRKATDQFNLTGFLAAREDQSMITGETAATISPPIWKNGLFTLNRVTVCGHSLITALNNEGSPHDCPSAAEGWDEYVVTKRRATLTLDPDMTIPSTRNSVNLLMQGTIVPVAGIIGTVAGNRVSVCMARGKFHGLTFGVRDGNRVETIEVQSPDTNNEVVMCTF